MIWRKLDCLNPNPQKIEGRIHWKMPETGAAPCDGFVPWSTQPPERGAMPSEGIQGDEWGAYLTLLRTTRANMGSPKG